MRYASFQRESRTEAHDCLSMAMPTPSLVQDTEIAMTVRAAVLDLLRAFGMTSIFGNPGSTELPLFRGFPQDFRYVLGLQEAVVVGMADGYAQATHNAAFVNLHSAAGVGAPSGQLLPPHRNPPPPAHPPGPPGAGLLPHDPCPLFGAATPLPPPHADTT